jgi:sRNA-binding protein
MNPEPPSAAGSEALAEQQPDISPAESHPAATDQGLPARLAAPESSPVGSLAKTPELSPAACGARLAELFPALFVAPGAPGPAKPIKLRIHADIQARMPGVFTKRALGIFFSRYTTSNAYLRALSTAAHRFDLDGQPAGEIAAEHRQAATDELARRHALALERRAAQLPPPRRDMPPSRDSAGTVMPGAQHEAPAERRTGARADARTGPRPDARRAARPVQRPRADGPRTDRRSDAPLPSRSEPAPASQAPARLPVDPAQRERALLLRAFESSPLSKANFCALKGIAETALDAALVQARAESGTPPGAAPRRSGGR